MEEIYRLIIEFKTTHPLRFCTAILLRHPNLIRYLATFKEQTKSENRTFRTQMTASTVVEEKETVKPKLDAKKENQKFETPQTKVYTDTSDKVNLEVNEQNLFTQNRPKPNK